MNQIPTTVVVGAISTSDKTESDTKKLFYILMYFLFDKCNSF